MKKPLFMQFNAEILDKRPDNFEMAGYDDQDLMFIKGVAIEEGVNGNDALFERDDLHRSKRSLVGKPLKIRFVNNNPTGHGFDKDTGTFDEIVKHIGFIYDVDSVIKKEDGTLQYVWNMEESEDGTYQLVVYMVMWQKYLPEIAQRLRQLHVEGSLAFSIEAERDFEITPEGYRKCFNILFNGLCVVSNPAFENARSLIVAELLNNEGGKSMDFEKLYNEQKEKLEKAEKEVTELKGQITTLTTEKELAETEKGNAETKVTELAEKVATLEGKVKTIEAERDGFKTTVETAEKTKTGAERMAKLSKYGEVAKSNDELAEMSKEDFVTLLEEMVENYNPEVAEKDNKDADIIGTHYEKSKSNKESRKQKLLGFIEGISK